MKEPMPQMSDELLRHTATEQTRTAVLGYTITLQPRQPGDDGALINLITYGGAPQLEPGTSEELFAHTLAALHQMTTRLVELASNLPATHAEALIAAVTRLRFDVEGPE